MSQLKETTTLNNTPNVTETLPNDAPKQHRRGCPSSSKGIVKDWWWQRLSAAALVPLSVWFLSLLVTRLLGAEPTTVAGFFSNPFFTSGTVLLLTAGFIHTRIGLHEIVTDYVHAPAKKHATILLVDLLSLVLGLASIVAVIQLHRMA